MSITSNKANIFTAIVILLTTCTISVSAQTPVTSVSSKVVADSVHEVQPTTVDTKAVPATEQIADVSRSSDSKPESVRNDTSAAGEAAKESVTASAPSASSQPAADEWQFQLTPYLWIPTISGRAGIGNHH